MPCVPVTDSSRVVVRRGMVTYQAERSTTWVRECEYDVFRRAVERYFHAT